MTAARRRRRPDVATLDLVGGVEAREIVLQDHDSGWADQFAAEAQRIRAALGDRAIRVEHIGSTSVPGLAAKPIVDVLVVVDDITADEDYVDPLVAAGYPLRVREPGHRMVRTPDRDVHVHVIELGAPAARDYLLLRDHLRRDASDRELYEGVKRALAQRDWSDMNDYADAKSEVVTTILEHARAADIRPRRADDLDELARVLLEVHRLDGYPVEGVAYPRGWLEVPGCLGAWVAEVVGRPVGHVALAEPGPGDDAARLWHRRSGAGDGEIAVLTRLFVSPFARGLGLGGWLIETATVAAQQAGRRVVLDVMVKDAAAIATYRRMGWESLGRFEHRHHGGSEPAEAFVSPLPRRGAPEQWCGTPVPSG